MVTGPLFKWFGSKWNASKHYPRPLYDTLVEPFAGGAGYALRYADKRVVLAETNTHLLRLWRWIIDDASKEDVLDIPLGLRVGEDIRTIGLSDGQALLLKHWQRTNNVGDCWTISPWGNSPGQWTANTRARVADEIQAVKHWQVLGNAEGAFSGYTEACTWFIDPPYQYNYAYKTPPLNYARLASAVRALNGQIIVCEATCPKTGAIPDWLPFVPFRRSVTSRRKSHNNHHSNELVWIAEANQ